MISRYHPLISIVLFLAVSTSALAQETTADVLIYGGTPSGIASAVSVAKAGRTVILLEPTDRIGGLVTCGLSYADFRSFESLTGFFYDFSNRVEKYYAEKYGADSPQVKDSFRGTHGEPSVNLLVLEKMISEQPKIKLIKQARIDSVELSSLKLGRQRIVSAAFVDQHGASRKVFATVFIDGSYEGDLMALAGEPYHVGRESSAQYGEPLAGNELREADGQVQGYNLRLIMTDVESNKLMPVAPEGYRREDFVGVLPHFTSNRLKKVFSDGHDGIYRAHMPHLPNAKADVNDTPTAPIRLSMPDINDAYPNGDTTARSEIVRQHYYYNIGLLYFLQNDAEVPEAVRKDARRFGWCKDEFKETGGVPPQLYIREARRMIGQHVFTGHDTEQVEGEARAKLHTDSIATGDYIHNCHGTGRDGTRFDGKHIGEFYKIIQPFQVPYGVIVPQKSENLLVPVACSASHFGFGALRLEPIWCSLGQAAGWAAAMSIEFSTPVQKVDARALQKRLHKDRSATVYVADVSASSPHFEAIQAIGTAGGLHGIDKGEHALPKSLGGQYREAFLGHSVDLNKPMDQELAGRWSKLLSQEAKPITNVQGEMVSRGDWLSQMQLVAGATLRFEFPDLPNTLAGLASGTRRVPVLSVELPRNYTGEKKFPLFVYLKGYDGGQDDTPEVARWMVGREDFIAVSLPLFKKQLASDRIVTPITSEDFEMTRDAYRVMLDKLFSIVPNVESKRSCIGGHSNGAHALGVLLAGGDEYLLDHFDSFYLHEGGMALFMPDTKIHERLKQSRLLVLLGEHSMGRSVPYRDGMPVFKERISKTTAQFGLNCQLITMKGYGHDVPPEYHRVIGQWARGQVNDDVAEKERLVARSLSLPLKEHADASNWNDLLMVDLSNMKVPDKVWSYREGILTATEDKNIWTKAIYGDCVIDLEFKFEPGANSGLFLYNSDVEKWMPHSIEIQICDDAAKQWQEKPATWHCGAFFGHQPPIKSNVKPAGEWNRMTVTCQGPLVTVLLNGELVNEIDLSRWTAGDQNPDGSEMPNWLHGKAWAELPKQGRIGFQGRHAGAEIEFRNVNLLRL